MVDFADVNFAPDVALARIDGGLLHCGFGLQSADSLQSRTTRRANAIVGPLFVSIIVHGVAHFGRSVKLA